jgi:DNA (cytosine-5)-methyltransferase 1
MKILNLYAGIGGNRKLWGDEHEITAVENNESIANVYKLNFPNDKVIIADAHQYLLDHYKEFDFIWSSPPCPTHSKMRKYVTFPQGKIPPKYPDMKLYEEILFLMHYFKGKWVVENVNSFYKPLIEPKRICRHFIWSNFEIKDNKDIPNTLKIQSNKRDINFNFGNIKLTHRKDQVLHNCVEPELGLHILKCVLNEEQSNLELIKEQEQDK